MRKVFLWAQIISNNAGICGCLLTCCLEHFIDTSPKTDSLNQRGKGRSNRKLKSLVGILSGSIVIKVPQWSGYGCFLYQHKSDISFTCLLYCFNLYHPTSLSTQTMEKYVSKVFQGTWTDCSAIRSTGFCFREPRFENQNLHSSVQL